MNRTIATCLALARANARYWPTVAPAARAELRRWDERAAAIPDPALQALARAKLREERFNAEVAATLATVAPRAHRRDVVAAIVALEVMYDYLDAVTERPSADPLGSGRELFRAFTDAVTLDVEHPRPTDDGYLQALRDTVRAALSRLPAAAEIAQVVCSSAARCAEAQIRLHAAPIAGNAQLEQWARREAAGGELEWRERLAGSAASVLAVHALIAAAADPGTTAAQAVAIDATYLSICALSTMLDSLVDHDRDARAGEPGFDRLYTDGEELAGALVSVAELGIAQARALPRGAHHAMTLVGVVAYYTSALGADDRARPVTAPLRRRLAPLYAPALAVMRAWRAAKRGRMIDAPGIGVNGKLSVYDDVLSNRMDIASPVGVGEEAV